MLDAKTISVTFKDSSVAKIALVARRGPILYGFGITDDFDIVFVKLLEADEFRPVQVYRVETIDANVILRTKTHASLLNQIQVTVSCFLGNAYLKESCPQLENQIISKVFSLISEIPQPEAYSF